MPEFLTLVNPEEALERIFQQIDPDFLTEQVPTEKAVGRITATRIVSPQDLPDFRRSTVDGYAVRAKNTHGASDSLPAYLQLVGEVLMGQPAPMTIKDGECALIHTGGMLPAGSDGVVMLEDTQALDQGEIEIYRPAASGENLIEIGEDVKAGEQVIPKGIRLRPAEIGGLMALGITAVEVVAAPRFGIISSGDEVIPPDKKPAPGQVRDINSYTLGSLLEELGGEPVHYGIIPDDRPSMREAIGRALRECDHLIVTAGSSASARDLTAEIMNELGDPGVLVHGLHIKPGKPTILALAGSQLMIGLPGNPVSALVIAWVMVKPIVERYLGIENPRPLPSLEAELSLNVSSQAGREDWIPVRLVQRTGGRILAEPVFGRSNLIFILARADGLVRIPPSATGLEAGTQVTVQLME